MNITRRKFLLGVWALSIILAGILVGNVMDSRGLGLALSLSLLAVSLGVPLMRAMTEFSK